MNVYLCSYLALATEFDDAPPPVLAPLVHFLHDDSGQDTIEYALVASFIGLATVTGIHGLASEISNYLNIVDSGYTASLVNH